MSEGTRAGLLQAAEQILIDEGVNALTIRRIGAVSGLNPALTTYHFGTVANLLAELCRLNLDPIIEDWRQLDRFANQASIEFDDMLAVWLTPLTRPAAFNPHGRALVVLDEIAAHSDTQLSEQLLKAMVGTAARVRKLLQPFVPELGPTELRARLRFISAAALGPPPRNISRSQQRSSPPTLNSAQYLIAFAKASLTDSVNPSRRRPA